eukprot:scaffold324_cov394-Prasinococcus_capsulatus_cf.AAC.30
MSGYCSPHGAVSAVTRQVARFMAALLRKEVSYPSSMGWKAELLARPRAAWGLDVVRRRGPAGGGGSLPPGVCGGGGSAQAHARRARRLWRSHQAQSKPSQAEARRGHVRAKMGQGAGQAGACRRTPCEGLPPHPPTSACSRQALPRPEGAALPRGRAGSAEANYPLGPPPAPHADPLALLIGPR